MSSGSKCLKLFIAILCRSLNSNSFSGSIPPSIGNLSSLSWLDLTDNKLNGTIPISSGTTTGLDMLVNARHLYVLPLWHLKLNYLVFLNLFEKHVVLSLLLLKCM